MKNILFVLNDVIDRIPIVNLLPILSDQIARIPAAYESMSEAEKQKLAADLLKAAAKAAASYGGSSNG